MPPGATESTSQPSRGADVGSADHELRVSARGLIIDENERVLLCEYVSGDGRTFWITPGGRRQGGESLHETLCREMQEEVGLAITAPPELVWRQTIRSPAHFPGYAGVDNFYFLLRVDAFTPRGQFSADQLMSENVHGFRWWTLGEIVRYEGAAVFAPLDLATRLQSLLYTEGGRNLVIFDSE